MWGGTDEDESVNTIHDAAERAITLIDTAPAYGFGRSEEIVGRAVADSSLRSRVVIATKTGVEWRDGKVFRNAGRNRILREGIQSLRRLKTDYLDIYQVHWPDPLAGPREVDKPNERPRKPTISRPRRSAEEGRASGLFYGSATPSAC